MFFSCCAVGEQIQKAIMIEVREGTPLLFVFWCALIETILMHMMIPCSKHIIEELIQL